MPQIDSYHDWVFDTPWGNLFYQLLFYQLTPHLKPGLRVLDFGSGFGKTAEYISQYCEVVAYEPNEEMIQKGIQKPHYQQWQGNFDTFKKQLSAETFDLIIIHNVLEYVENPEEILQLLKSHLKQDGEFSIVKHNLLGHVYSYAVLEDDPEKALATYNNGKQTSQTFGQMNVYSNAELVKEIGAPYKEVYGLRSVFGLSSSTEVKQTKKWQENMLALEKQLSKDPVAKETAFFQHLIF